MTVRGASRIPCNLMIRAAAELCVVPAASGAEQGAGGIGLIREAALAAAGGTIAWVGPEAEADRMLAPEPDCVTIDAAGCTVLPGLIDPHTHLLAYGSRAHEFGLRLAGASYLELLAAGGGIHSTVERTQAASDGQLLAAAREVLREALLSGVTTLEAKSGYGLSTGAELRLLRLAAALGREQAVEIVSTFLGAHAVPPEYTRNPQVYVELLLEEMLPVMKDSGLAEFCDIFCEPGVFSVAQARQILTRARELGFGLKVHADELAQSGGAELAAELGAVSADHLMFASEEGAAAMSRSGTVAVLLPVTVLSLLGEALDVARCRRQARMLRAHGVRVALGTDYNPGTAPCASLQLAMGLACRLFGLSPAEAVRGVTRHAALAVGRGERLGSLEPGKSADVAIYRVPGYEDVPYRLSSGTAGWVVKRGRVVVSPARLDAAAEGAAKRR
jgi:imidazolonepropionase